MIPSRFLARASVLLLGARAVFILVQDEVSAPLLYRSLERRAAGARGDQSQPDDAKVQRRMSIDFGDGTCEWTDALPAGEFADIHGTLFPSYPGSGMRVNWQHAEGISGVRVGDDFKLGAAGVEDRTGLVKTQYPHLEGIWSWGSKMDQVVLLVRNPRWAIPSYHSLIFEIHYAHDWETAYLYFLDIFQRRPPMENWIKWRDYRFEEEIDVWGWHIDFWMEGGTKYWMELDFERNGQWPFRFLNDTERYSRGKDLHCLYDLDCKPKEVIQYEKLLDSTTGPGELTKIGALLEDKKGFEGVVSEGAISCVYEQTWIHAKFPFNDNRDHIGPHASLYMFTENQLELIIDKLQAMIDKYGSAEWTAATPLAAELVDAFEAYKAEVEAELDEQKTMDLPPTKAPTEEYHDELVAWYNGIGKGNRYAKEKVQQMFAYWPKVKHLYD